MGALAPILGVVSAIGGTIMQVGGAMQEGREQEARFKYEQKVQEQQADEAMAASQRDAMERTREGRYLASQQRAAIAGSGGDLSDPSVIDIMDDTQERVALARETEMFKGEQQSRGYNDAAKISGINASNAMRAARVKAGATLFAGASSMFSRFGQSNMKTATTSGVSLPYG